MNILEKFADVLYQDGDVCDHGIEEGDLDRLIKIARKIDANKPIRAVKDWSIWDLDVPDSVRDQLSCQGLMATVINANYVLYDSTGQFQIGSWVRTTALKAFHLNAIFESKNTLYILVGRGDRKKVDPNIALAFF
ncbi:MAG: hypothetical protein QM709_03180 [Spongiibacteraceae bacterium]